MNASAAASIDPVEAIARSVLYEGYILWPYRRSALKNRRRWTFGCVFPEGFSRSGHDDDASLTRTECILETHDGEGIELNVVARFLHVVDRRIVRVTDDGAERFVDTLTVQGVTHSSWQEAFEREIVAPAIAITDLAERIEVRTPIAVDEGGDREPLLDADGRVVGAIVREWAALDGWLTIRVTRQSRGVVRVRVDITNTSAFIGGDRESALRQTFASTHTVLRTRGGSFVSAIDPPSVLTAAADACRSIGSWPVLVGHAPARDTMLSSPIILYDYPTVAPESTGDFFDGAEIDQLLVLGVLSMTEDEQRQMAEADPRAREILGRCRSLTAEELLHLHGVTRELRNDVGVGA